MGRPKPLLAWSGTTLIQHQVRCLLDGGAAEVVVVLGHEADAVAPYVDGPNVRVVVNPDYCQGRSTSVKAGLRAIDPSAAAVLLLAVDQPRTSAIVSTIVTSHVESNALITSPRHGGRGGHPLVFAASLKDELAAINEESEGVREVFQRHRSQVNEVIIHDPMVRLDLNTPEEYAEAFARYGA